MVREKEILEIFEKLGLTSEEERRRMLSQGVVSNPEEDKTAFWIEADNATSSDRADNTDAGLESTAR